MGIVEMELEMQQLLVEKAVVQGKFEIAADILHDIGNAVVGFGSYLTRIKRTIEQGSPENLVNLTSFFYDRKTAMSIAIGEAKAGAVIDMLQNIVESQHAGTEEIQHSITEQLNIISHIQEILNIQRLYIAGQKDAENGPVNLRCVINDCLSMLFASIEKQEISVNINIETESPGIQGDRTRLMQVFMNILKNGIEAVQKNTEHKTISIGMHREQDQLILNIADNGMGFDAATAALIFGRGFTTKSSGTGLGLHNCQAILAAHAGTISISSEGPGQGALTVIRFNI